MGDSFDPYLKWLGIPKKDQPPHHYRLLGVETFESDPEVISNAADQRMAHLKNFSAGQHSALSQKILNEIAAARVCLLNDSQKEQYDAELRAKMPPESPPVPTATAIPLPPGTAVPPGAAVPPPPAAVPPSTPPPPPSPIPQGTPIPSSPTIPTADTVGAEETQSPIPNVASPVGPSRSVRRGRGRSNNSLALMLTAGVIGILAILLFVVLAGGPSEDEDTIAGSNTNRDRSQTTRDDRREDSSEETKPVDDPSAGEQPADESATDGEPEDASPADESPADPADEAEPDPADEPSDPLDEPTGEPAVEPPTDPPTTGKAPEPRAKEKEASQKAIRAIYGPDLRAAETPEAKQALADAMYNEAGKTDDDRASQFVLFELSAKTAAEGFDLTRAFRAIDKIESIFEVDSLGMKAEALDDMAEAASSRSAPVGKNAEVVRVARQLSEQALEKTELRTAERLMKIAMPAARRLKNRQLVTEIDEATRKVSRMRTQQRMVEKAVEVLEKTPDNPESSLTAGNWYCFVAGDWEKGLPWLAQCSNPETARIAALDLSNPTETADLLALGDGWWELSKGRTGVELYRARKRAAIWYKKALPDLSGLEKTKVEKRLREAGENLGKFALKFDGSKSHVVVGNFSYPGNTPITVEALVRVDPNLAYVTPGGKVNFSRLKQTVVSNAKLDGLSLGSSYNKWHAEFAYAYKSSPRSTRPRVVQAKLTSGCKVESSRWIHLALVFHGASVKLFVEGRLEDSETIRGVHKPGSVPFIVGAAPRQSKPGAPISPTSCFGGDIKALRISNTARYTENFTPPDILRPDSSARLLFDFSEGQGTLLNSAGKSGVSGTIKDAEWVQIDTPADTSVE